MSKSDEKPERLEPFGFRKCAGVKGVDVPDPHLPRSPGHQREFCDGVKSRKQPSCSFAYHYNVHVALNLGDLSYRLGRRIVWDDLKGEAVGDKEANEMLQLNYRKPWVMPA